MMREDSLLPADDGVAAQALTRVQTATTRVKTTVAECVYKGLSVDETTKRLNAVIAGECKKISDAALREQTRKALVTAARKWHYQLKQTYKILNENLKMKAVGLGENLSVLAAFSPEKRDIEFRKILDDGTSPASPLIRDYWQSVKIALKALSAEPAKVTAGGVVMPLRNRAEMAVRYAANVENLQELIAAGYEFAWTSSHPNCSPRCKDFQGRLWSLHGLTGELDGIHYDPIEKALKGPNGDGNGIISGYNCRHRLIGYRPGSRPPKDYSEAEIKREYAIDRRQRAYENRIRQMKTEERLLRSTGKVKEAAALRKDWRRLTLDYEIYSEKNKRPFYRYRCVIDEAEEIPSSDKSTETNIKENKKNPGTEVDTSVKWSIINNKRYFDQFKSIAEKRNVANSLSTAVISTLRHRDNTKREDLYLIDIRSGVVAAKNLESKEDLKVAKNPAMEKLLSADDGRQYVLFHNHPLSSPPSVADLNSLYQNPKIKFGVIVGHDGTIYKYTSPKREIYSSSLLDLSISSYLSEGYSLKTATEKAYEDLSVKFEFNLEVIKNEEES